MTSIGAPRPRSLPSHADSPPTRWHTSNVTADAPNLLLRGMDRLLAGETNVSDLLQLLTDLDPTPLRDLVGVVPRSAMREHPLLGNKVADLVLKGDGNCQILLELKLGNDLSDGQAAAYEVYRDADAQRRRVVLAALSADRDQIADRAGWTFLTLASIAEKWTSSQNAAAREISGLMASTLTRWDGVLDAVLLRHDAPGALPVNALDSKFLARVASREIARRLDVREPGSPVNESWATVSNGGGMAIAQALSHIAGDSQRCLIAEVRWKHVGARLCVELRFGVDFWGENNAQNRGDAWQLATQMSDAITARALRAHLIKRAPGLVPALTPHRTSRTTRDDGWDAVVRRGFRSNANPDGIPGDRRSYRCGFVGDGTLRFEEAVPL